jgi:hypothetical protein
LRAFSFLFFKPSTNLQPQIIAWQKVAYAKVKNHIIIFNDIRIPKEDPHNDVVRYHIFIINQNSRVDDKTCRKRKSCSILFNPFQFIVSFMIYIHVL